MNGYSKSAQTNAGAGAWQEAEDDGASSEILKTNDQTFAHRGGFRSWDRGCTVGDCENSEGCSEHP